jgi:release factor glutamine methyltransferase
MFFIFLAEKTLGWVKMKIFFKGKGLEVYPQVYEPAEDTFLIADYLKVRPGEKVLELGTGCGLLAILAAEEGAEVVATDINALAIGCARRNAVSHGVENRIDFRLGNLFEPVVGEKFDLIIFNPPYLPTSPEEETGDILGKAWEAGVDGRAVIDPFLDEVSAHLTDRGRFIFVQSSLSDLSKTISMLNAKGLSHRILARKKLPHEELFLIEGVRKGFSMSNRILSSR